MTRLLFSPSLLPYVRKRALLVVVGMLLVFPLFFGCHSQKGSTDDNYLPQQPNYSDTTQWYTVLRNGDADLFYIISTETGDYQLPNGTVCHYADTYADSLRAPMLSEMTGVETLLSGRLNFFSPFYRQCSLQSFTSQDLADQRLLLPLSDVRRAFAYYLEHQNQGRPFILAGFSQGAMIALSLLCEMDDDTYSRLVATYLIGISVPQSLLDQCPRIKPALSATDQGVTICYNSVRDTSATMWPRSALAINPVNWCTDTTPATFLTEPSPLLPVNEQTPDTITVRLDPVSNLLLVSGYTATDYVIPLIGKEGNYHSREIWLYRHQLRENMQQRALGN